MKKRISIYAVTLLFVSLIISGCTKSWLDINKDPNNPEDATMELLFPAGVVSVASQAGGYYNLVGGFWAQYWTQSNASNQYKAIDQYSIDQSDFNANWREMYVGGLSDLQLTIDKATAEKNSTYFLMATVMQAYAWQVMTDFHGSIPYFEAFQGDTENRNTSPAYDTQELIYTDLIARIDKALDVEEYTELSELQASQDFLFQGNVTKWIQFANTLKLKMYLRLVDIKPTVAEAGIKKLYENGGNFLSEDAYLNVFIDEKNKDNPLFGSDKRNLNVASNLRVSSTIYRYLFVNNDPRRTTIMTSTTATTVSMPQGGFNLTTALMNPTTCIVFKLAATDPVYFISEVESYLMQAEAIIRGWGTGDAKALYELAIEVDFVRRELAGQESTLIATGGVYEYPVDGSFDQKLKSIIMAKWVAFMGKQCLEAFFEHNRTGYPEVSTIPAWIGSAANQDYNGGAFTYSMAGVTDGKFPKRMIYPQSEVNLNKKMPGVVAITERVWWDVK